MVFQYILQEDDMNAYYNDFSSRTVASAAPRRRRERVSASALIDRLLTFMDALLAAMSRARVAVIIRVVVTTLCFFGFIGVVGGLEAGNLSWPAGFAIVAVLAVVEGICLRKIKK